MPFSDYKINCFVHIPRTGGNFLLSGLYTRRKPEGPLFLFGLLPECTGDDLRQLFLNGPGTYVLHGHGAYGIDRLIPEYKVSYFTFLREPVARTLSDFFWGIRLAKVPDKIQVRDISHKWIDSIDCANHQTRYLARPYQDKAYTDAHLNVYGRLDGNIDKAFSKALQCIDAMCFAGQTERMPDDYATLLRRLEVEETEPPKLRNAHPHHEIVSFLQEDKELIEKISGKTRYDRALHHYAGSLLGRNIEETSIEISRLNLENADLSGHARLLHLYGECQAARHSLEVLQKALRGKTGSAMGKTLRPAVLNPV